MADGDVGPPDDERPGPPRRPSRVRSLARPLADPSYRALWISLITSELGDWAARLALAVLVLARSGSPVLAALVVAVSLLPWTGPGQILATRFSHLPRRRVMIAADLFRAALFAAMLGPMPPVALVVLAAAAALATPVFETARSSLTVDLLSAGPYADAMALNSMTSQVGTVGGYLLGGLTVAAGGARVALGIDVASFLVSAVAVWRIREPHDADVPVVAPRAQLAAGWAVLRADPVLRRGVLLLVGAGLPAVAVEASAASYARLQLHASPLVAGVLATAVPVAVLAVTPVIPRHGSALHLLRAAAAVAVTGAVVGLLAFLVGDVHGFGFGLAGALAGFAGAGIIFALSTPAQVAFQPRIPRDRRPAVIALAQGSVMGGQACGAVIGGLLAAAWNPWGAAVLAMAGAVVAGTVALLRPVRSDPGDGAPVLPS